MNFKMLSTGILCCSIESLSLIVIELFSKVSWSIVIPKGVPAGTPFGITIDHETLENNSITIRERDSMEQHRIPVDNILKFISENK